MIEKCFLIVEDRGTASELLEMDFFKNDFSEEDLLE